jgi:uncharacterized protein (DUF427 family)
MKAIYNGKVLAESQETVVVENNHYFPESSLHKEYFKSSDKHTTCPWKGIASYYTIDVNGNVNPDAAWYYPEPSAEAKEIKDHVAFWKGVEITQ